MNELLLLTTSVILLIAGVSCIHAGWMFRSFAVIFQSQTGYLAGIVISLMGLALLAAAWFVAPLTLTAG